MELSLIKCTIGISVLINRRERKFHSYFTTFVYILKVSVAVERTSGETNYEDGRELLQANPTIH